MADQHVRTLMAQGLQAFRAGGQVAQAAISEIHSDATDPELLADLQASNKQSEQWAKRVERAIKRVNAPTSHAYTLGIVAVPKRRDVGAAKLGVR